MDEAVEDLRAMEHVLLSYKSNPITFVDCKVWVCVLIISGKEWSALSSFPSTSLTFPEVRPKAQVLKMNQS